MSDSPKGVSSAVTEIGRAIVSSLPPAFLLLCLINVAFLWIVLTFVQHQTDARLDLINRIVDRCSIAGPK